MRVSTLRLRIVLAPEDGILFQSSPAFELGMRSYIGNGDPVFLWLHIVDVVQAIQHYINNKDISSPVNFTAPHPVTARCFASQLKKVTKAKIVLPILRILVRLMFSEEAMVLTNSHKARPRKLTRGQI